MLTTLPSIYIAFAVTLAAGLATVLGGFIVFSNKSPGPRTLAFGLSFAGGAMICVSLTEIIVKSEEAFSQSYGTWSFFYTALAFLIGMASVKLMNRFIPEGTEQPQQIGRLGLLAGLAITAHNFPEGLATFFATVDDPVVGLPLAIAIAIHNIPEGISIAAPVYYATRSKKTTLIACLISGLAEPLGAVLGYSILHPFMTPTVFGTLFGLIAGVMVSLSVGELLPAAKRCTQGRENWYGMAGGISMIVASLVLFNF